MQLYFENNCKMPILIGRQCKTNLYRQCMFLWSTDTRRCPTPTQHLWLHWIMSFSQIIIHVGVLVSVLCSVSVSVYVLHIIVPFSLEWVCAHASMFYMVKLYVSWLILIFFGITWIQLLNSCQEEFHLYSIHGSWGISQKRTMR